MRHAPLWLIATLLTSSAFAQKICILPARKADGEAVRQQLVDAFCEELDCVSPSKVADDRDPNWKKARKHKVSLFISIAVAKKSGKLKTQLSFLTEDEEEPEKKVFPLADGKLSDRNLSRALELARKMVGETPEPPPEPPTQNKVYKEKASSPPREPVVASSWVFEAGTDLFARTFSYSEVQTPNLRSYSANLIAAPRLHVEYFPFAHVKNAASGLALEGNFAFSVGLTSRRSDGPSHPTSITRAEIDAKFRWKLLKGSELALVPLVGIRHTGFNVGEASDGTVLEGLPGVSYLSVAGGLGAEVPFAKGAIITFGRFTYLHVLSSGEILSRSFFPRGSNSGIDVQLGIAFHLLPTLQARFSGTLTRYGMTFETQPGDPYVAAGAIDQYIGGAVNLRYLFE